MSANSQIFLKTFVTPIKKVPAGYFENMQNKLNENVNIPILCQKL